MDEAETGGDGRRRAAEVPCGAFGTLTKTTLCVFGSPELEIDFVVSLSFFFLSPSSHLDSFSISISYLIQYRSVNISYRSHE